LGTFLENIRDSGEKMAKVHLQADSNFVVLFPDFRQQRKRTSQGIHLAFSTAKDIIKLSLAGYGTKTCGANEQKADCHLKSSIVLTECFE
jgi:hypothetical protein